MSEIKVGDRVRHVTARDYRSPMVVEQVVTVVECSWVDVVGIGHRMSFPAAVLDVVQMEPADGPNGPKPGEFVEGDHV